MTHRAWWVFKDIFLLSNPVYPSPLDLRDYWDAAGSWAQNSGGPTNQKAAEDWPA